jgi:hypothetical protein
LPDLGGRGLMSPTDGVPKDTECDAAGFKAFEGERATLGVFKMDLVELFKMDLVEVFKSFDIIDDVSMSKLDA